MTTSENCPECSHVHREDAAPYCGEPLGQKRVAGDGVWHMIDVECTCVKAASPAQLWKQAEAWANAQVKAEGLDERMAVPLRVGKYNELMREAGHVVPASEPESDA